MLAPQNCAVDYVHVLSSLRSFLWKLNFGKYIYQQASMGSPIYAN